MSLELISMLGGGLAGFIFRYMAASMENQQKTTEMLLKTPGVSALYLPYISPTSPLHLRYISATSPLHLRYISATSPLHLPYMLLKTPGKA